MVLQVLRLPSRHTDKLVEYRSHQTHLQHLGNQNPDNKNQETATASNTQPATQTNTKQTTDKSPKTGDYNNPLVWAAWLIVSEIIIAGTVYYRKKKHL